MSDDRIYDAISSGHDYWQPAAVYVDHPRPSDDYPDAPYLTRATVDAVAVVIPAGHPMAVTDALRAAGIPVYAVTVHPDPEVLMGEDWGDAAFAFRCQHCGRPAYYDPADEAYHHAARPWRGCFLIPPEDRPEDPAHPLMAGRWAPPSAEDVDWYAPTDDDEGSES